jgi:hypothetical protein
MKLVDIGVRTGTDKALFHNFCEIKPHNRIVKLLNICETFT